MSNTYAVVHHVENVLSYHPVVIHRSKQKRRHYEYILYSYHLYFYDPMLNCYSCVVILIHALGGLINQAHKLRNLNTIYQLS
jgi:hypothetical protein